MHFDDHEVTIYEKANLGETPFEFLRWQKPGSNNGLINFVVKGQELFVTGDWYEAIYVWSQLVDLQWVAKLDPQYLNGKCQASPGGRNPYDWSEKECMSRMRNTVNQAIQDYPELWPEHLLLTYPDDAEEEALKAQIEQYWEARIKASGAESSAYSKHEWMEWLGATNSLDNITEEEENSYGSHPCNGEIFFGEGWQSEHPDGEVIAYTTTTHLEALKLAMAWLKKFKEKWQTGDDVYWSDPDEGTCSRTLAINTIEYLPDDVVRISEPDGSMVECLLSELS